MTPAQQNTVIHRARVDAQAVLAFWPYRGNPFHTQAEVDLYEETFKKAMEEAKVKR